MTECPQETFTKEDIANTNPHHPVSFIERPCRQALNDFHGTPEFAQQCINNGQPFVLLRRQARKYILLKNVGDRPKIGV